ncbi:MAG TPA: hypothetical protein VLA05_08110 [Coriobacteriia bacterium]|nr:hypothetical protein [Coriobacteriia bacterium]
MLKRPRKWLPASIIALFVTAGIALPAAVYGIVSGVATPQASARLGLMGLADLLGALTVALTATQLIVAGHYVPMRAARFMRAHRTLGWVLAALAAVHAAFGVINVSAATDPLAGWLIALGVVVALVLVELIVLGRRVKAKTDRVGHSLLALTFAAVVVVHSAFGIARVLGM